MTWVASAITVGTGVAGAAGEAGAGRQAEHQSAKKIAGQQAAQQQATGRVNQTIDRFAASQPDIQGSTAQFLQQLRANSVPRGNVLPTASRQFRGDVATANQGAQQYGGNMAELFARLRAPQQQRQMENIEVGHAGNDIERIQGNAQSQGFLSDLKQAGMGESPWAKLLVKAGGNLASGLASRKVGTVPAGGGSNITGQAFLSTPDAWGR